MRQPEFPHQQRHHLGLGPVAEVVEYQEAGGVGGGQVKPLDMTLQPPPGRGIPVMQRAVQIEQNSLQATPTSGASSGDLWKAAPRARTSS